MGSFNTTCFASGQTISDGNDCYIFAIRRNSGYRPIEVNRDGKTLEAISSHNSTCYTDAFWEPTSPLIKAKYADYGQFELENSDRVLELFDYISKEAYNTGLGPNSSHDVRFDLSTFDAFDSLKDFEAKWEYMWEAAVRESRLFLKCHRGGASQLSFAVISEEAVDYLIDAVEKYKRYDDLPNDRRSTVMRAIDAMTARKKWCIDEGHESHILYGCADTLRNAIKPSNIYLPFSHNEWEDCNHYTEQFMETGTLDEENILELIEYLDTKYLISGFENLNIKIQPMVYSGQDYDNSIGKAYAKFVRSVSAQITKKQKARYEE
jgi:hypothetical protein